MQSRRNMMGIAKSYQRTLEKRPYLVQAIQAGILMGAGDLCAQTFFPQTETVNIDYVRTLKFCSIGFVLTVRIFNSEMNVYNRTHFLIHSGPMCSFLVWCHGQIH